MQAIKVFFNTSYLLISDVAPSNLKSFKEVYADEQAVFSFRVLPQALFEVQEGNILLVTPYIEETLESIFDYANGIIAAGGLVQNEKNETLIIHRRGFWDLPKGKVEKGEKIQNAAQREVEEETGVFISAIQEEPIRTYHSYVLKGQNCIKETYWYRMQAKPTKDLKPQTAEGIDEVRWATDAEMKRLKPLFYPLIVDLLQL